MMVRVGRSICVTLTIISIVSLTDSRVQAGAFAVDEQGAAAMGRANAFSAQADDPSALFYNPAGIVQVDGTQVGLGTTLIAPATTFESQASNNTTDTESALFYPPTLYISHEFLPTIRTGLGVFVPFGLSTEWPGDWEGRYVTTFSEINTIYLNPNVVWSATPSLHIAGGLTYVPSSVTLRSKVPPLPDSDMEIKADGDGWGYNLAVLAALPGRNNLGISFRSAVSVDYSGDTTVSPSGLPDQVRSSLTFPPILTMGIAHHVTETLTLEADWQWVGWATVDKITIDFAGQPASGDSVTPKNWENSSSLRLGVEREFERSVVRGGYAYDMTPIPNETIDPSLADSDKQTFALGWGYRFRRASVDLAYMFIVSRDREVANTLLQTDGTPFDHRGKYSTRMHELGLGFTYRF
jgi:long-chain fatty acid transport protein